MNERLGIAGISIVIFAVLLGTMAPVQAVGTSFTIGITVYDTDGTTPVDGVTVTVTNLATGSSVDPVVTADGGRCIVNLANLKPNEAHGAGDNIQIVADAGPCKMNTTVVPRAATSPQYVDLILQGDITAPAITDLQPADGACVTTGTPEICANYSDATGINTSSVTMKVDGADVTITPTETGVCYTPGDNLDEGEHTVMVNVSDICGNPSSMSWVFTVDTIAPAISDLMPVDGACVRIGTPEICANYSDGSGSGIDTSSVTMKVDGTPVTITPTETGVCYTPGDNLDEGEHTVMVNVSDVCGNPSSMSWVFTVDTIAPTISDLMPVDGACVRIGTPEICANYSDATGINTASVTMKVDGTPVTITPTETGVCYTPTTSLGEGGHTVMVNVSDICGNPSSMSWSFTVDTIPPAIVVNEPPTPANNSEVTVNYVNVSVTVTDAGCGVDAATVVLEWNGTVYPMIGAGSNYFLNMTDLPNGDHNYRVQANDTAGNPRVSDTRVVTVNVTEMEYNFTLELVTGYNLISVPVNDPSVTNASSLAAKIGGNCTEVVKWDSTLQQLVSHLVGWELNNFAVVGGEGYYVNVNNPTSVEFSGDGWTSPFEMTLAVNFSQIGMPVNDTSVTNAATLAAKIGGNCTEIVKWDSATQTYVSYLPGWPTNNFFVVGGEGYLVNLVNPTDVTFEGAPWEN